MLYLDIDIDSITRITRELQATEKQFESALRTTLGKMASWLRVRSIRGLSDHLQVQQKILRRRLKTFRLQRTPDGHEVTVWYGLDDIPLIYMGARQTKTGVTAGRHKRDGAFIASGRGGSRQVFKRRGKSRLPVDKQGLEIQDKAQVYVEDNLLGTVDFDAQFLKTFEHELKWQTRTRK